LKEEKNVFAISIIEVSPATAFAPLINSASHFPTKFKSFYFLKQTFSFKKYYSSHLSQIYAFEQSSQN